MARPQHFPQGHYAPDRPVIHWEATYAPGNRGDVVLTASIADDPNSGTSAPLRGQTATTLEVRMDRQAAMNLYAKLTELGRSMGWLPKEEGERQV
jgi:hypothetical protein